MKYKIEKMVGYGVVVYVYEISGFWKYFGFFESEKKFLDLIGELMGFRRLSFI